MQKLKMKTTKTLTFEEGCNRYLEYCQRRNLRQGSVDEKTFTLVDGEYWRYDSYVVIADYYDVYYS